MATSWKWLGAQTALILAMMTVPAQATTNLYESYLTAVEAEVTNLAQGGLNKAELDALRMKVANQPAGVGDGGTLPFLHMLQRMAVALNERGYTRREMTALRVLRGAAPKVPQTGPSSTELYTGHLQQWGAVAQALNARGYNRDEMAVIQMFTALAPPNHFEREDYAKTYPLWTERLSLLNEALRSRGYTRKEQAVQTTLLALQPRLVQAKAPTVVPAETSTDDSIPPLPRPTPAPTPTPEAKDKEEPTKDEQPNATQDPPPFHQPSVLARPVSFRVCGHPYRVTVKHELNTERKNRAPNFLLQLTTGDVVVVDSAMCRSRFLSDEVSQLYLLEGTDRVVLIRRNGDALVATHNEIYRFARNVTRVEKAKASDPAGSFRIVTGRKRARASRFAPKPGPNGLEILSGRQSRMAKRLYRLVWGTL